jgi:hypothetical protein
VEAFNGAVEGMQTSGRRFAHNFDEDLKLEKVKRRILIQIQIRVTVIRIHNPASEYGETRK